MWGLALACATGLMAGACQGAGGSAPAAAHGSQSLRHAARISGSGVPSPASRSSNATGPQRDQGQTVVSLTFDDAYLDQYLYGAPLIAAHKMTATYYVINADPDAGHRCCMSWWQLYTLQAHGNDIGSHTTSHPDVTKLTTAQMTQEICGSRQDMISHGITDPQTFAYPFGIYNATVESVVRQCGFNNARTGGGISDSNTTPEPPYLETIPPRNPYALKTVPVDGRSPMQLSDLERFVTAAAARGGGWLPLNFHEVCHAGAADFSRCMSTYGPVQDSVLGKFLDWLVAPAKTGGAPAGVVVKNVCEVMRCR